MMNQLANMLHSLCCEKKHSEIMEETKNANDPNCHFYLEQTFNDPWIKRDHVVWTKEARAFMEDLSTSDPAEAFEILKRVMNIVRAASILLEEYPMARTMLIKLLS